MGFFDNDREKKYGMEARGYVPVQGMTGVWYDNRQDAYFEQDQAGNPRPIPQPSGVFQGIVGNIPPPSPGQQQAKQDKAAAVTSGQINTVQPTQPNDTIENYLVRLLNSGMDREAAAAQAGRAFGLSPGQDGYPLYYANNGTIGLQGSYLVNEGGAWKAVPRGPEGGAGSGFGGGTIGDLAAPFTEQFAAGAPYPGFRPPSGDDLLRDDPGYTFRLGQGQKALEQSAASRGVLNTGGTLKDILGYGQSLASQEYKGAYDRALGQYQTNYRTQFSDPEDARYRDYLTRYNVFRSNQNDPFNKYLSVAQLGANTTA